MTLPREGGSPDGRIRRVVVLGGGSAGWLTAGLLAAAHRGRVQVTVIEAPDLPPIGVGEGTWPTMRDTLRDIGVREADFVRACDATFKQGSLFRGWVDGRPDDLYFHPFSLPEGYTDAPLAQAWKATAAGVPFAAVVSAQPHLCMHGLAPKQPVTPEFAAVANYGYHFDAGRFGPFLREHCVSRLGVRHVADEMVQVRCHDNGDIAALLTRAHGEVEGDLFVDCTGMAARLLAGHYGVGFLSRRETLCCDRALALQLPYEDEKSPIACQTVSTAQPIGWVWDIGLQRRRGVGLVYSSEHASDDEAARVLHAYVAASSPGASLPEPRRLRFEPGYRQEFWHRNCVAIGLSAGFLEPLEASALALIEFSAGFVRDQMPATRGVMEIVARRFNDAARYRWERIVEFLKLHYVLSRRDDHAFWRAQRSQASCPERLATQLALWREMPPSRHDFERHDEAFPSASYQYILYGMGFDAPDMPAPAPADLARAQESFATVARQVRRMLGALPSHRELVEHVRLHGMHTV